MEEHLASCGQCRRELDSWLQLESALRSFPVVPEPVGFKKLVMQRIELPKRAPAWASSGWMQLFLGVGVSFLLMGVLVVATILGAGLESPALWEWQHQASVWLELYLADAYPNLLAAGWLLAGALAVALLGVASSRPKRMRA